VTAVLRHALARLARRRGRSLLAAGGIAAAGAMLGAAVTVGYSLTTGFDRAAAAARLPDVIARFDARPLDDVDARTRAIANVAAVAYRLEVPSVAVYTRTDTESATVYGVGAGRRGYAVVEGRDLRARDELVVERGLARAWKLEPGDELALSRYSTIRARVVGVAVSPETPAYPLVGSPRLYVAQPLAAELAGRRVDTVDTALVWVANPRLLDVTLAQARAASFGVGGLEFVTRAGVRVLIGRAAGIVVSLLGAFALVALAAAATMLAAAAAAEVQRRLEAIGVLRALGASRRDLAAGYAVEAALVAAPAAAVGLFVGWATVRRPTGSLLVALNQLEPGATLAFVLVGCWIAIVAVVAAAAAAPTWRAASRAPAGALRGADVMQPPRATIGRGGTVALGVRLALARPLRTAAAVTALAATAAVVLLILTMASLLRALQTQPPAIGKRYQLIVSAPAAAVAEVRRTAGVEAAGVRTTAEAADAFDLGESFGLIAYEGDHTRYEAPPLADGRRVRANDEAEVGLGLAHALNLHVGTILTTQLAGGREARFRVVGIVRAFERQGRVAYVQPHRLRLGGAWRSTAIAVRLARGADADAVRRALSRRGLYAEGAGGVAGDAVEGWAKRNSGFVDIVVALLRAVAVLEGIVCLYALVQLLVLTAEERRQAVAVLRALGASRGQIGRVFAGATLVVVALAAPVGFLLERLVVGPAASRLALSYVSLPLSAGAAEAAIVAAGLAVCAAAASTIVTRRAAAQPITAGLREE